jgi:NAD(P)-dependent dehydrogenase (short-subunit alcohol dehydrogenase family)
VIGASGTIGGAVARRLAGPGVVLGLHYCNNRLQAEAVQNDVVAAGAHAALLQSPLTSQASCAELWERTAANIGQPWGVALCSGRVPWQPWQEIADDDWQRAFLEHCVVPFTIARLAAVVMEARGAGSVAYLSSIAAKYGGSPRTLHYAAAKAALEAAMRGLARAVAPSGVRVNGVRSGFVHTPQQAGRSVEEIRERVGKVPMRRAGTPDEIAAAICFALSAEAGYMTGEIITVAGGD